MATQELDKQAAQVNKYAETAKALAQHERQSRSDKPVKAQIVAAIAVGDKQATEAVVAAGGKITVRVAGKWTGDNQLFISDMLVLKTKNSIPDNKFLMAARGGIGKTFSSMGEFEETAKFTPSSAVKFAGLLDVTVNKHISFSMKHSVRF